MTEGDNEDITEVLWCQEGFDPPPVSLLTEISLHADCMGYYISNGMLRVRRGSSRTFSSFRVKDGESLVEVRIVAIRKLNKDYVEVIANDKLIIQLPVRQLERSRSRGPLYAALKSMIKHESTRAIEPPTAMGYEENFVFNGDGSPTSSVSVLEKERSEDLAAVSATIRASRRPDAPIAICMMDVPPTPLLRPLDPSHVERFKKAFLRGNSLQSMVVLNQQKNGRYIVVKGCHRVTAAQEVLAENPDDVERLPTFFHSRIYSHLPEEYVAFILPTEARLGAEVPPLSRTLSQELALLHNAAMNTIGLMPPSPEAGMATIYYQALQKHCHAWNNKHLFKLACLPEDLFRSFLAVLDAHNITKLPNKRLSHIVAMMCYDGSKMGSVLRASLSKQWPKEVLQEEIGDSAFKLRVWGNRCFNDDLTTVQNIQQLLNLGQDYPIDVTHMWTLIHEQGEKVRRRRATPKDKVIDQLRKGIVHGHFDEPVRTDRDDVLMSARVLFLFEEDVHEAFRFHEAVCVFSKQPVVIERQGYNVDVRTVRLLYPSTLYFLTTVYPSVSQADVPHSTLIDVLPEYVIEHGSVATTDAIHHRTRHLFTRGFIPYIEDENAGIDITSDDGDDGDDEPVMSGQAQDEDGEKDGEVVGDSDPDL